MQCRHASFLGLFLRVVVLKVSGLEGCRVFRVPGLQGFTFGAIPLPTAFSQLILA